MTASTVPPLERPVPEQPTLSPEQAHAAAEAADRRAAEARDAAAKAKQVAKGARAAAAKAEADAARLRKEAEPERRVRANLSTDQAKARLMDAARAIHPLQDAQLAMSQHPMTTVGVAAGSGFVLGSSGGVLGHAVGGAAKITASLLAIAKPFAGTFAKLAAAQFAVQQAAKAQTEAAPQEVHVHEAPDAT
jgi:ElaB/YqjD/DUF883 family membrane-anchored ribosome-binding protein